MNVTIFPGKLSGTVAVPPSKSAAHRGLIAAALKGRHGDVCRRRGGVCDKCVVAPIDLSEDIAATIRGLEAMGGAFAIQGDTVTVDGGGMFSTEMPEIDCGESGSTLRFLMPLAAAGNGGVFFGKGRLPERPIGIYETLFAEHGAKIERAGAALTVRPGLRPGRYRLPGDVSSQFITGLMLALPLLGGSGEIELISPLESKGYVGMTRSVMAQFGIRTQKTENGWRIPGNQRYTADAFAVEADWSQAAFWLAAGALGGEITLTGLDDKSPQGDSAAEQLFTGFGAQITTDNNRITVSRGILRPQDIDAAQIPDLIPALAVTAALAAGESKIYGGGRLRLKESDRIKSVCDGIAALGGQVTELPDGMILFGSTGGKLRGGAVDSHGDHRIVMAFAVLASVLDEPVTIIGAEAVNKSYPAFFDHFAALGGKFEIV